MVGKKINKTCLEAGSTDKEDWALADRQDLSRNMEKPTPARRFHSAPWTAPSKASECTCSKQFVPPAVQIWTIVVLGPVTLGLLLTCQ